jgi:hypothetical protein
MTVSELIRRLEKLDPSKEILCESSLSEGKEVAPVFPVASVAECSNFAQLVFKEEWL